MVFSMASAMAPAVEAALKDIFVQHGGLKPEAASEQLHALRSAGRYAQDVY